MQQFNKKSHINLGINLLFLDPGKVGGSETFSREILGRFDKDFAKNNKVYLYCTEAFAETINYKNIIIKPFINNAQHKFYRLFIEIFVLPFFLIRNRVHILFSLGYSSPLFTHCKKIVLVHDLQYKSVPQTLSFINRAVYNLLIPLVLNFNNRIIVPSLFSKNELVKYYNVDVNKISVIGESGGDINLEPLSYENRGNYIMTASATYPHKNVDTIIDSFRELVEKYGHKSLKLYITGFASLGHPEVVRKIKKYHLLGKVIFLGWVSRKQYLDRLKKAKLFIFLSSYEGFGLPPLEAMSIGTPVISSIKGSLGEVVGDACVKIEDEKDFTSVAKKADELLNSKFKFNNLINLGTKQARMFNWDITYRKILNILSLLQ